MDHRDGGISLFTVVGGDSEEYELLLGSIEYHARLGNHFVLDVGPFDRSPLLRRLPPSVRWIQIPFYGSGSWQTFRFATALERARQLALDAFPDTAYLVCTDSDEYWNVDRLLTLFQRQGPLETPKVFTFETIHWKDGLPLRFGESEWHTRAWDVRTGISIQRNPHWMASERYDGNPERHPLPIPKVDLVEQIRIPEPCHFHLHYTIGEKQGRTRTAEATITGWPNGTPVEGAHPWPEPIRKWVYEGRPPSLGF